MTTKEKTIELRRQKDRERYRNHPEVYIAKRKSWEKNNPERHKAWVINKNLLKRYGISAEERIRLYQTQEGRCANHGCDNPLRTKKAPYGYVDHNHITKQVRGLLCFGCNVSLGHLNDSVPVLFGLIEHLRRNS